MTQAVRVHLVDGTYELFRAHFSKRPPHPVKGVERRAVIAYVASMLALLHDTEEDVTHVAVAFDRLTGSFRNQMFDGYKTWDGVAEELVDQLGPAEEATRALGMAVWSVEGFEADDALATGALHLGDYASVQQVRLLTPDKDLNQVVRGTRIVQLDRSRQRLYDEDGVVAKRGVAPRQVPDFLALTGDTADGIPGLRGFGERSAAELLRAFGTLEEVPAAGKDWPKAIRGAAGLAAVFDAQREDALLYKRLATLRADVPLAAGLEALTWPGVPRTAFLSWCDRLEARDLRDRPRRWA